MAIINDNDMEIILKGDQETAIREMLRDRMFALVQAPSEKPKKCISTVSSSVFLARMNSMSGKSCGIRPKGSLIPYQSCEYYLILYRKRGNDEIDPDGKWPDDKAVFDHGIEHAAFPGAVFSYPTVDEFVRFIADKELVVITNYAENYANMENRKIKHFLNDYLLLRENFENLFVLNDTNLDVRVFMSKVDDGIYPEYGLYPEDVRNFDVRKKIVDVFRDKFKDYSDDENDICIEYESRSEEIQAAYFVTRYHSNKAWTWDPINVFNVRISAFVLPGTITPRRAKKMSANKKAKNYVSGTEYAIDSIHMNTDITYDLDEFKKLVDGLFYNVTLA